MGRWKITTTLLGTAGAIALGGVLLYAVPPLVKQLSTEALAAPPSSGPQTPHPDAIPSHVVVASGQIDVEGGTVPLIPNMIGTVAEVSVEEGEVVKTSQPLVTLKSKDAELKVQQAESDLHLSEVSLKQAQQAVEVHRHRMQQLEASVVAAQAQVSGQKRRVEKLEQLRSTGGAKDEDYQSAKDELVALEAAVRGSNEQLAELKAVDPQLAVDAATLKKEAARVQLEAAKEFLDKHVLRAPADGRILRVQVGVGQVVSSEHPQPLVWFCPEKPMIVRCEVEQEFIANVSPGMTARITNESNHEQSWVGKVRRAADWVAPRRSIYHRSELSDVPTIECIVEIETNSQLPMRIGQRVRVRMESAPSLRTSSTRDATSRN